ncbi:ABC transporter permease subunit [Tepidibacter aestuarii]|uniref:ABC transporter permease subunit n=1 Tax=Tepidibacter aestuarii TaxID=2925782 RepID=UPI0020BE1791|nr:ABC transporter permease [Tepidibacter aestuarii]CAH2214362.1 Ribose ABC transporter permease protein [Tepidibacter aestuarii]
MNEENAIKNKSKSINFRELLFDNMVTIMFVILCLIGVKYSGQPMIFIVNELIARISRNSFLVISLIIPVLAGMGLNFGIVIGAMAGQIALIAVTHWKIGGIQGFLLCALLTVPIAVLFGYLTGKLLNKTKGQEMIASMILGFFANGLYQLLFLFLIGTLIPMNNPVLVLSGGVGIKNTIDLSGGVKYALDNIVKFPILDVIVVASIISILYILFKRVKNKKFTKKHIINLSIFLVVGIVSILLSQFQPIFKMIKVPVVTILVVALLCMFNVFIMKTKLGQDFKAVGQDNHVAKVSGIAVDKIRIISIVISTVFAGWGQLIFLQNLGTLNTYGSHEQVGMFAIAALLIGGASVSRATISQAIIGTILFHTLFIVSPQAGKNLLGSAQIGEYFRVFVAYGVIGLSLGLHAWKKQIQAKNKLKA